MQGPKRLRNHCARSGLIGLLLSLLLSLLTTSSLGAMEATFAGSRAIVEGLTPESSVALAWVIREPKGYYQRVLVDTAVVKDEDGDGTVSIELDHSLDSIGPKVLMAVVDLTSGEWLVTAPPNGIVRWDEDPAQLEAGPGGDLSRWTAGKESVVLLAVRPGGGAWSSRVFDGGGGDVDQATDGSLTAALDGLASLVDEPTTALTSLESGDVLIALDPHLLAVSAWADGAAVPAPTVGETR